MSDPTPEPPSPIADLMPDAAPGLAVPSPPDAAAAGTAGRDALALLPRLRHWARVLAAYFTAQVLTQLLGLAAGLLLVRTMPVREFALYTLASSVITFFTFVSDLGSTSSLLYFYNRTAREGGSFAPYLAAVRSLRRLAFAAGAAVVAVALPRTALGKGFGAGETALCTAGVLLCVWFQIGASLSVLALRLEDRYGRSYRAEIAGGGVRLASAAGMAAASRLYSWLAVLGNAAAIAMVALLARPQDRGPADRAGLAPHRRQVVRYLLPTLPSALYFSIQGPLVVWLAATFGATRNIAEVGALGRLGMLLSLFSNLSAIVFLPRLSRLADERLYRTRCIQFGAVMAAIAGALIAAVAAFPHALLALLGAHYASLTSEVLLVVCGSGITLVGGYLVSVNLARSWTRWQGLAMICLAVGQAAMVKLLPLGTTRGVLVFNVLSALIGLTLQLLIAILGFTRPRLVHWE
jgi:O-antigen/teichoic acid export membrane protein